MSVDKIICNRVSKSTAILVGFIFFKFLSFCGLNTGLKSFGWVSFSMEFLLD